MTTPDSVAAVVPLDTLHLTGDSFTNPRLAPDPDHVRELALSIGRHGLLTRLIVARAPHDDDRYVVLAGLHRYHAISMLQDWRGHLADDVLDHECEVFDARAAGLRVDVPVEITAAVDWDSVALIDNLQHRALSSYEVAHAVWQLSQRPGATGAEVARQLGKSPSWVSRHLTAWRQAGPALKRAWLEGLAFERVLELAALGHEAQAQALEPHPPRAVRGAANRPGIDQVKAHLAQVERAVAHGNATDRVLGLVDALRWVAGRADLPLIDRED